MLLGFGLVSHPERFAPNPEILLEACDRFLVATVLFEAAPLVEEVVGILELDEQLRENRDTFGVVAVQAGRPGLAFSGLLVGLLGGGKNGPRYEEPR